MLQKTDKKHHHYSQIKEWNMFNNIHEPLFIKCFTKTGRKVIINHWIKRNDLSSEKNDPSLIFLKRISFVFIISGTLNSSQIKTLGQERHGACKSPFRSDPSPRQSSLRTRCCDGMKMRHLGLHKFTGTPRLELHLHRAMLKTGLRKEGAPESKQPLNLSWNRWANKGPRGIYIYFDSFREKRLQFNLTSCS